MTVLMLTSRNSLTVTQVKFWIITWMNYIMLARRYSMCFTANVHNISDQFVIAYIFIVVKFCASCSWSMTRRTYVLSPILPLCVWIENTEICSCVCRHNVVIQLAAGSHTVAMLNVEYLFSCSSRLMLPLFIPSLNLVWCDYCSDK